MIEKYYRMAGVELAISLPRQRMYEEDGVLAPFRVESVRQPHRFRFSVVKSLPPPEGVEIAPMGGFRVYANGQERIRYIGSVQQGWQNAYIRAAHRGMEHDVQIKDDKFPGRVGIRTVLNALEIEHLIVRNQGVILHCSYIDWRGNGILFTAPSGTGKSTQADLWHQHRNADIINGDRAVMRIQDGHILAGGIPFSGSSPYCKNRTLPLAAVVYLGQAPVTTIRQLQGFAAFRKIWEGCSVNTWDRTDMELAMDTVQRVIRQVPVYQLDCTPDEAPVIALEQALNEQVKL